MEKTYISADFSTMPWTQFREKVRRKDVHLYNGIRVSMVCLESGHTAWMHSHATEQSVFVLDGECFVDINEERYTLHKNCLISVPSWAEHQVVNAGDQPLTVLSIFSPKPETEEEKPAGITFKKPYVFDVNEREWEQVRDKVKRKICQTSDVFTFSYVQLDGGHLPKPHNHEDIQIVLCLNNRTTYYVDNEPIDLHKGVIVASAPWAVHNSENTFEEPVTDFEMFWPKRPGSKEAELKAN